jgi:predicted transcriptional regulator
MKANEAVIIKSINNGWKIVSKHGIMFIGGVNLKYEVIKEMLTQGFLTKQTLEDGSINYVTTKKGRLAADKFPTPIIPVKYVPTGEDKGGRFGVVTPAPKQRKVF